jgi:hypothetical protein
MKPSNRKYEYRPLNLTVLFQVFGTKQSALLNHRYRITEYVIHIRMSLGLQFLVCENDINHVGVMVLQGPTAYTPEIHRQSLSYSRFSQHCTEARGSLLRSQEPSIGPYSEQDESSPYHHILFL